jgi:tellurite resistance protein TehA-like permease
MATGIVSRALAQTGAHTTAAVLFGIAAALYTVLLAATALKAVCHPQRLKAELRDPSRLFGHYTLVAASGVLAARLAATPFTDTATALFALAALAWAVLSVAAVRALRTAPHRMLQQAEGTWFLGTVGLQSLALSLDGLHPDRTGTAALTLWTGGTLLYVATAVVVAARLVRHPPRPADLTPAYWVTMGAAAITVLAGSQLLIRGGPLAHLVSRTLLSGVLNALWAWASCLIPLLLAAGIWRHLHHRVPLSYEPALWCIVFPLGMYATATTQLVTAQGSNVPATPERPLAWTATAAWLAVHIRFLTSRRTTRP